MVCILCILLWSLSQKKNLVSSRKWKNDLLKVRRLRYAFCRMRSDMPRLDLSQFSLRKPYKRGGYIEMVADRFDSIHRHIPEKMMFAIYLSSEISPAERQCLQRKISSHIFLYRTHFWRRISHIFCSRHRGIRWKRKIFTKEISSWSRNLIQLKMVISSSWPFMIWQLWKNSVKNEIPSIWYRIHIIRFILRYSSIKRMKIFSCKAFS